MDRKTNGQRNQLSEKHTDGQTEEGIDRQMDEHVYRQTDIQVGM
jgi:hypothetical protein